MFWSPCHLYGAKTLSQYQQKMIMPSGPGDVGCPRGPLAIADPSLRSGQAQQDTPGCLRARMLVTGSSVCLIYERVGVMRSNNID